MTAQLKEQVHAALQMVVAVGDAIRDLKEVPSGHLYANLCGHLSFAEYEKIILILKSGKVIEEDGFHMLRWIGPPKP